jgi:hypothetical protein
MMRAHSAGRPALVRLAYETVCATCGPESEFSVKQALLSDCAPPLHRTVPGPGQAGRATGRATGPWTVLSGPLCHLRDMVRFDLRDLVGQALDGSADGIRACLEVGPVRVNDTLAYPEGATALAIMAVATGEDTRPYRRASNATLGKRLGALLDAGAALRVRPNVNVLQVALLCDNQAFVQHLLALRADEFTEAELKDAAYGALLAVRPTMLCVLLRARPSATHAMVPELLDLAIAGCYVSCVYALLTECRVAIEPPLLARARDMLDKPRLSNLELGGPSPAVDAFHERTHDVRAFTEVLHQMYDPSRRLKPALLNNLALLLEEMGYPCEQPPGLLRLWPACAYGNSLEADEDIADAGNEDAADANPGLTTTTGEQRDAGAAADGTPEARFVWHEGTRGPLAGGTVRTCAVCEQAIHHERYMQCCPWLGDDESISARYDARAKRRSDNGPGGLTHDVAFLTAQETARPADIERDNAHRLCLSCADHLLLSRACPSCNTVCMARIRVDQSLPAEREGPDDPPLAADVQAFAYTETVRGSEGDVLEAFDADVRHTAADEDDEVDDAVSEEGRAVMEMLAGRAARRRFLLFDEDHYEFTQAF